MENVDEQEQQNIIQKDRKELIFEGKSLLNYCKKKQCDFSFLSKEVIVNKTWRSYRLSTFFKFEMNEFEQYEKKKRTNINSII